jgi:hypothetical protein
MNFKSKIVCIALLTSLCWSFAFTGLCFANDIDFQNISPEQKAEYLALPEQDSKILLMLLIQDFTNEKIDLEASGQSSPEQRAVPSILRSAIRMDILNHLLIHAPIEAIGQIIKASVKITQSFVVQDVSGLISKIEKFTAQKAVEKGMDFLLQNEIKISPGAMEFEYISQNNEKKRAVFQYIIVYQAIDEKFKRVFIKFYSPDYIEPPKLKARWGDMWGMYNDLSDDLPPFVVAVDGIVEKNSANSYNWVHSPKISIDFPDKVEDFGIKPLSFWEKRALKPIETKINDIKIVFTELIGKKIASDKNKVFSIAFKDAGKRVFNAVDNLLTNLWTRLGEVISDINPFGANIGFRLEEMKGGRVSSSFGLSVEDDGGDLEFILSGAKDLAQNDRLGAEIAASREPVLSDSECTPRNDKDLGSAGDEVSQEFLRDAQEQLDDIAEMIDVLSARVEKIKNERDSLASAGAEMGGGRVSSNFEITELAMIEEKDGPHKQEDRTDEDEAGNEDKAKDEDDEDLENETNNLQEIKVCSKINTGNPLRDKVIFNEIAWMGNSESASNEWIELKNISGQEIDLSGWQIIDKKNQIEIVLPVELVGGPSSDHFLLERGDDDSVSDIAADFIYTGALNNSDEELYLFDENCVLQDKVVANPDWLAGDNKSKRTMERKIGFEWQTSSVAGGTPGADNSSGYVAPVYASGGGGSGGSSSSGGGDSSVAPSGLPQNDENGDGAGDDGDDTGDAGAVDEPPTIIITEIQIQGAESGQANYDFIELYNFSATTSANISGCQIKKRVSSGNESSVKLISDADAIIIEPLSYFVWLNSGYDEMIDYSGSRATTTQTLARDNSVAFLDKNKNIIDAVAWGVSTNPFVEEMPFSQNPEQGKVLGRKFSLTTATTTAATTTIITYIDTDNNFLDFEIQDPSMGRDSSGSSPQNDDEGGAGDDGNGDGDNGAGDEPLLSVVINEIAWAGTLADYNDEWIELYNNTTSTIDITGWTLKSSDGTPDIVIVLQVVGGPPSDHFLIPARGFYLMERTDDDSVKGIEANFIYTGALKNNPNCEILQLFDSQDNLIDQTSCLDNGDWPTGNNDTKQTMERVDSRASGSAASNWVSNNILIRNGADKSGNPINGTPKAKNSAGQSPTRISQILPFDDNIDEIILYNRNSPYLVSGVIEIPENKTLLIEPGAILKFSHGSRFEVFGTLSARGGNEPEQIIFTSFADDLHGNDTNQDGFAEGFAPAGATTTPTATAPGPGDWQGIYFMESSNNSVLHNCAILYSGRHIGGHSHSIAINIQNTDVEISNSVIRDFSCAGIVLHNSSSTIDNILMENNETGSFIRAIGGAPTIKNSIFRNGVLALDIEHSAAIITNNHFENFTYEEGVVMVENGFAYFSGNSAANNFIDGILILGDIARDWTLSPDLPYIIRGKPGLKILENAKFTILRGVTIKLKEQAEIEVLGILDARAEPDNKITFTSLYPSKYWGNINFSRAFATSTLTGEFDNIIIENGGYGGQGAISARDNSRIEINNATIRNCHSGMFAQNTNYQIANSNFIDCGQSYSCFQTQDSDGEISDSIFSTSDPAIKNNVAIMVKGVNPVFNNVLIESNECGIHAHEADACVDLSGIIFGTRERANETDIIQPFACE